MSEVTDRILDWDSAIEDDGNGFVLLPEGDYEFVVSGFERGQHNGSANIPRCPKAILTLSITSPEGVVQLKQDLFLCGKMEWKIAAFFRSLGLKKHGERLVPQWDKVQGEAGHAHVVQREYIGQDGTTKKANNIAYFIDPIPMEKRAANLDNQEEDIPF